MMCAISVFMLVACEREQGVQAGGEDRPNVYQPAPAPTTPVTPGETGTGRGPMTGTGAMAGSELRGELIRIDQAKKTIVIRTVNGMEQTLKFNDQTMVTGQSSTETRPGGAKNMTTRNLMGKEGSEVMVQWREDAGSKLVTSVTLLPAGSTGTKTKTDQHTQPQHDQQQNRNQYPNQTR
jgi:hypothetical protein